MPRTVALPSAPALKYSVPALWLAQASLVLLLAWANPNHFTTIDSGYYLASAQYLLEGRGYLMQEANGQLVWNGTFPPGYPALIALVALLTQLPVLWASKILNLLAAAGLLVFIFRKSGKRPALLMGALLLLGPFVKLWAHTWSEPLFLVLLLVWVYSFFQEPAPFGTTLLLGLSLMGVRYAGVFIVPLAGTAALYWIFKKNNPQAQRAAGLGTLWALSFAGYLWLNYQLSGEWSGGDRLSGRDSLGQVVLLFGKGLLNEVFLLRDATFESGDVLFWLGAGLQLGLMALLGRQLTRAGTLPPDESTHLLLPPLWLTASTYLLFLFGLRLFSPFDAPGYRLLSPCTFLFLWGVLLRLAPYLSITRIKYLALALLLASWLHLLPQTDVVAKLDGIWKKW
jgi:hypothetical protein